MYDIKKVSEAISKAYEFADQFKNTDDGGTCNSDSAYMRVPHMRERDAQAITEASGVRCYLMNSKLHGGRILMIGIGHGQANRRTVMAEAAKKFLEGLGFKVGMWYQMD